MYLQNNKNEKIWPSKRPLILSQKSPNYIQNLAKPVTCRDFLGHKINIFFINHSVADTMMIILNAILLIIQKSYVLGGNSKP